MQTGDDATRRPRPNFMQYPRPNLELFETALPTMKQESQLCIQNLLNYRAPRTNVHFPRGQSAAVLVPLFVGRGGDVYVLLSRRSSTLREYAGDTALPGGKVDARDSTVEDTARREAFEEIGLPQDPERVPILCIMEPFLAGNQTVVTPVVAHILDKTLQPNLNESEVTSIFAKPLASFLTTDRPSADPSTPYHTYSDRPWSQGGSIRVHSFLTGREADGVKPVFGLTANVLIRVATIGYGREPRFEVNPPNAPTAAQQIAYALLTPNNPLRVACDREGVNADRTAARILRPPKALNAPRMIEWENIGGDWKRLMEGSVPARANTAASKGFGDLRGGKGASIPEGIKKHVDEIKKHVQALVEAGGSEGMEDLDLLVEGFKKRAAEGKPGSEEHQERPETQGAPDIQKLRDFLDSARDMVQKRREELSGDEEKLRKARKAYPKIMEGIREQLTKIREEHGEVDLKALLAMVQENGLGGMESGVNAGRGGVGKRGEGDREKEEGIMKGREGKRKGLGEMKKYIGQGRDEQLPRKRDAKL